MIIDHLPEDIAISSNGHYYIEAPVVNWGSCHGDTIAMCPDVPHMRKVTERGCVAAIIRDDRAVMQSTCEIRYVIKPKFPSLAISLGNGDILISGPEMEGQLLCGSQPPAVVAINHFSVITLGCDCAFLTAGSWLPYSLRGCGSHLLRSNVTFVRNELLDLGMRNPSWTINMVKGREVNMLKFDPLPKIVRRRLEHKAKYQNSSASINFKRLSRELSDEEWEVEEEIRDFVYSKMTQYASGTMGSLGIVGIILIIILICCCLQRREAKALLLSSMPMHARTEELWSHDQRGSDPNCSDYLRYYDAIITGLVFAVAVLVAISVYLGLRMRRARRYKMINGLYLQLGVNQLYETVHLGECQMPLDHVFQLGDAPLLKQINIDTVWGGRHAARLHWGRQLYATSSATGEESLPLGMPESVPVSGALASHLHGIREAVVMARLLRYSDGLATVVPLDMPMITSDGWTRVGPRGLARHNLSAQSHQVAIAAQTARPPTLPRDGRTSTGRSNKSARRERSVTRPTTEERPSGYAPVSGRSEGGLGIYEDLVS